MACLLPHFKCPSYHPHLRPSHHTILPMMTRDHVCFKTHCVLSRTIAVVDSKQLQLPSLESHASSLPSFGPFTNKGATGLAEKRNFKSTLAIEMLLTGDEAVIAAAAAEAVTLARAAVEVAKDAAGMRGNNSSVKLYSSGFFPSEIDILHLQRARLASNEPQQMQEFNKITVRSGRQHERKGKRARASAKTATGLISVKAGPSSRRKHAARQDIDFLDPLHYLRGTTSSSRLLTASEELELSEGIQDLLKLERLQKEIAERNGHEPTFVQWALAAGVDQKTLRKRLDNGILCKDKMIKSNIRLVISIAKKYQCAGMNLQDLVQEGCRGLIKGAEKFDASKGFKFSTYAHWWIKQAVRKFLSDQSRTIRLPVHMVEAAYRVREARKQLYTENRRYPTNEEIAEATGLTMKRLEAVMLSPKSPRSLDQKIGINQDLKPSEVIAHPDAETSEDIVIKQFLRKDLNEVLDSLNPRETKVVRWRFGLEDGGTKTLQEIGELMGISRERVRQIESCAVRKLKNKKRTKNLRRYLSI